ncbi:cell division protein FtsZ [Desulfomonile tiedjei]|uniref:Cell division protein FtsZ n=1 Tax=Desulfomonile tiedjei (strain ATCC 49306 / DSM 6799 / DCB-1) TaxID=706587 RepID=I4CCP3_DESTA|nr:cell division protein FtsZ [Desulfomonile tiedjei]AFM27334.1 cell division protein FtsZ [Desulfomonile tiedjei DSM 6799]
MLDFEVQSDRNALIRVIGVGGGGGNAVNNMIRSGLTGVEFIAANTDAQSLQNNLAETKLQIGNQQTKGLGAGADPEVGRIAANEDYDNLRDLLEGADMVFITAGLGGGTGTGAAPIIARIARQEVGALTVAVVTKPFLFEGKKRMRQAEEGIEMLRREVDTLIIIPNQRLLSLKKDISFLDAFRKADDVLLQGVRGISDLVTVNGLINLDFADVRTIMQEKGIALMGTGSAIGEGRVEEATRMAINSPLLEDISMTGARGVLINVTGSSNMTLSEINDAVSVIQNEAHDDANIIFGAVIDEEMGDAVNITVIATGFGRDCMVQQPEQVQVSPRTPASAAHVDEPKVERSSARTIVPPEPKDSHMPAFIRRTQREKNSRHLTVVDEFGMETEEDLDIPTFLRKS